MRDVFLSDPVALTAYGDTPEALFAACMRGDRSLFRKKEVLGKEYWYLPVPDRFRDREGRATPGLLHAAARHLKDALAPYDPARVAVLVGSCDYLSEISEAAHRTYFKEGKFPDAFTMHTVSPEALARILADDLGTRGITLGVSLACSSGGYVIADGADLLLSGEADAVVAAGVDIASGLVMSGFLSLGVYSPGLCNPFSRNRNGITIGEGLGAVLLTRERKEGSVRLLGCGLSSDGYHATSPDPEGKGAEAAMRLALGAASLEPSDIGYVNLHGTGTVQNDAMEQKAVNAVFGPSVPCSSTKSVTGHALGAAGTLEAVIAMEALQAGQFPPLCNDGQFDESLPPVRFVLPGASYAAPKAVMSVNFAFGGANCAIVLGDAR